MHAPSSVAARYDAAPMKLIPPLCAAVLLACASAAPGPAAYADLVVTNARIYTVDAKRPWAEAFAVRDGRIVAIGTARDAQRWIGPSTRRADLGGRLVTPAFHDTHTHLALAASRQDYCDLGYPADLEATRHAMQRCVERAGDAAWILMANPNTAVFPEAGPDATFLEAIARGRPLVVNALHSSFASSEALVRAGIGATTRDPHGGVIVRDDAGRATGTLRGTAQDLLYAHVPKPSAAQVARKFRELVSTLPRHGVVSIQELSGTARAPLYADAVARREVPVRIRHGQVLEHGVNAPPLESGVGVFAATARRHRSRWLDAGAVKIFVDGDLGDQTAALTEPYAGTDADGGRGEPNWTQAQLDAWVIRLDAEALQLHFHAMGDRAIHMALDAIERAQRVNGRRDARHQISHLHVIAPADLPRFKELGVIANVQPYFAENIAYNTVRARALLGPTRHAWMFRFRDLIAHGATLVASTDGPVASPLDPFVQIQAALTRREPGSPEPAFLPEQRLTLPEVLAAYTLHAARANFLDDSGSLEVGKWADFVVLDRDIFVLDPEQLRATRILWTVLEGRETYRAPAWTAATTSRPAR